MRDGVLLALLFLFASIQLFATSVLAPSFENLVDRAELIFTGQVISQHPEWKTIEGQKSIVTLVSFRVEAIHKGSADSTVMLQFLGGTLDGVTLDVSDMPKFKPGERAVLFVAKNGVSASPLLGFYHGKFSVQKDESGHEVVLKHNGQPLTDVAEIGRAKTPAGSARAALSHEEFISQIRARAARGNH